MSLIFTDGQIKDISKEYLLIPDDIAKAQATLAKQDALKAQYLQNDQSNKVFTDNLINIMTQYHEELKNLNGETRTTYQESITVEAAQFLEGNQHFPTTTPVWKNYQPKVAASNNGGPITNTVPNESSKIGDFAPALADLLNGFSDGAVSEVLTSAYAGGSFDVANPTALAVGNRVIISQAGVSAYGIVASITPGGMMADDTVTITEIVPPAGALGIGATAANSHPGFTNNQRSGIDPILEPEYYNYLTGIIDAAVASIEGFLAAQLAALNLNDVPGSEAAEITAAKNAIIAFQGVIDTWQAASFRFSDANLAPLQAAFAARPAAITARAGEITTALGNVAQNPDGSFSGAGHYQSHFSFTNIRINRIEGSLVKYYGADQARRAMEQKIATLESKGEEYDEIFVITRLTADTDGTNIIKVTSAAGLSNGDSIKIMDDVQPVIVRSIVNIVGLDVQVDSPVPVGYLESKIARVVKQL